MTNQSVQVPENETFEENQTLISIDPYGEAYEDFYTRLYVSIATFLIEVPGNYLLAVLVVSINEDPLVMLTDRLLSLICVLAILVNAAPIFVGE